MTTKHIIGRKSEGVSVTPYCRLLPRYPVDVKSNLQTTFCTPQETTERDIDKQVDIVRTRKQSSGRISGKLKDPPPL
jgi:hypothetical protein